MPSKSIAQQHLMQAAEHGAQFPMADKLRNSMTHQQLHDFSVGSEANKPQHVAPLIKGATNDAIGSNVTSLKQRGMNEFDATKAALKQSRPYANTHKRLGKFLHPRKDGKPHGSDFNDDALDQ